MNKLRAGTLISSRPFFMFAIYKKEILVKKYIFWVAFCFWLFPASHIYAQKYSVGQRFILTCPKTQDRDYLLTWMKKTKPAGVMLEASHVSDRVLAKKFTVMLQQLAREVGIPQLLIALDWEGGIVSRANEEGGFVSVPAPYKLAQGGRDACFLAGKLIGAQLRSVGINVDFAPSLDLFNPKNYVLGTRCFSASPEKVVECGVAFAKGLLSEGVLPVAKHFPGLGLGETDTHLGDVKIDFSKEEFTRHASPFFHALGAGIPAMMVSHAIYPCIDKIGASKSCIVAQQLKKHNADVLLFTDDIYMQGFHKRTNGSIDPFFISDVIRSLHAGFNFLIFSEKPEVQCALIESLQKSKELKNNGRVIARQLALVSRLCGQVKQEREMLNEEKLSMQLARTIVPSCQPIEYSHKKKIFMITVDLPKVRPSEPWFIEKERSFVGFLLHKQVRNLQEVVVDAKKAESIEQVRSLLDECLKKKIERVIVQTFFYGQGDWNKNQIAWLEVLKPISHKLTVLSLGHPYEKQILGDQACVIELGAFHKPELTVVADRLLQKPFKTGAERFVENPGKFLQDKRFALLCHGCSYVTQRGKEYFLPDVLADWATQAGGESKLVALLSPEHGLFGTREAAAHIASERESKWGCPIYSLHGDVRKPTKKMLEQVDVLLIDLQDVGVRCFTYISTMVLALEAATENDIEVIVLDRPNPLKSWGPQGPGLELGYESFVGKIDIPFIHGQTIGELARLVNKKIGARLTVMSCFGDDASYFETCFKQPSPNIRSQETLYAYPLTVFIEGTNYSEGRGTDYPFQQIGAPWVDGEALAKKLNNKKLPGVYFEPVTFIPRALAGRAEKPKYQDKRCSGIFVHITDRPKVMPIDAGRLIIQVLFEAYPNQSQFVLWGKRYGLDLLVGNGSWRTCL